MSEYTQMLIICIEITEVGFPPLNMKWATWHKYEVHHTHKSQQHSKFHFFKKCVFRHLLSNFFQTCYDNRDHQALHFDISVDDLDFIQGHSLMRNQRLQCPFSQKFCIQFGWNLVCIPQPVGLWRLELNLFFKNDFQWRDLCWHNFIKCTVNSVLCQDTSEAICFQLGMMQKQVSCTVHFQFEWPWCSCRVTGKLELVRSFWWKYAWNNANVHDGWLCREMTVKKSCMANVDN